VEVDSELGCRVEEEGAELLTFIPLVDIARLTDPCIIDAF
jgi:hypothetical protein